MNTSNITQSQDTTTTTKRGKGFLRRGMAGAVLAAAITATGLGFAAASHADFGAPSPDYAGPEPAAANCKVEPFGPFGFWRRTLCDGPIAADGSWSRQRTIWVPAHYRQSSCLSSEYTCSGGYFVPERMLSSESYPVRPDTVLPDEPGHLG